MKNDSVEFVVEYFDETFSALANKDDARIKYLKRYCNSLFKMRNDREKGSVIVNLQVMDSFKYLESNLSNMITRIEKGDIKIFDDNNQSCADVIVASFGKKKDSNGNDVMSSSGWKGSIDEFIKLISDTMSEDSEYTPGSNNFYLRSLPEKIIKNKSCVEFIIIGIVIKTDSFYDTAGITLIGLPEEREEDVHNLNVLDMFGYR